MFFDCDVDDDDDVVFVVVVVTVVVVQTERVETGSQPASFL